MNKDVNLHVTAADSLKQLEGLQASIKPSRLKLWEKPTQTNMFGIQAKCHLSMCYIDKGNYAAGYLEQIVSGLVVLWVRKRWSEALFDGIDYPYWYKTPEEAMAYMRWASKNYEAAQERMKEVRNYVIERHGMKFVCNRLNKEFEELAEGTYQTIMPCIADVRRVFALLPKVFKFSEFSEAMIKKLSLIHI